MAITKSDIEHLCGLSKLNLDDDEIPIYLQQMTDILEMIEQLQSADTDEITHGSSFGYASEVTRRQSN